MNAGYIYQHARAQAQANANRSGVSWILYNYAGLWWVERLDPKPDSWAGVVFETIKPEKSTS